MYKYDFYLRDYRSKTGHLDMLHHGAYKALLDAYYDSEAPLPNNPSLCHRLSLAFSDDEKKAVNDVLFEFFFLGDDGLFHNQMADEQIAKYRQFVEKQRENGALGGRPKKSGGFCLANPSPNPNETLSPSPSPTKEQPPIVPQGDGGGVVDNFFGEFWKMYPRKVGKGAAERAWRKIRGDKDVLLDRIDTALEWQCRSEQWTRDGGKYIPHPATYLNGKRWEDKQEIDL